jgi:S-adenosylmethionine:tRNA ribosyltransferase-isomerase
MEHRRFFELPELLRAGDCLVLNDSRVLPARLFGERKEAGGKTSDETGARIEVVLLRDLGEDVWDCLTRPGRKTGIGTALVFGDGELTAAVTGVTDGGTRLIKFGYCGTFSMMLERLGKMPLPPYIHEELDDNERYQTVYSSVNGSAAAPTAGLHFTRELLDEISARGVHLCYLTLHVGLGTFRPVRTDSVEEHVMHAEYYSITRDAAETLNQAKACGGRIIAVGTTSCRTLESCADESGAIRASSGFTDIFIYPGYRFKCVDGIITNFHLPESTLIMLVSALAGRENVLNAYRDAIRERYRFFSFGDAMLIV